MIYGIGTDIIEVDRIRQSIDKFGDKFLLRTFSAAEILNAQSKTDPTYYYAKRFAAKEAFAKALGTGIGLNVAFNEVTVLNNEQGAPYIELTGNALKSTQNIQLNNDCEQVKIHLSLSDEKQYAQAYIILELI